MTTTVTYTFDTALISDIHKDARGFRPREGFWSHWNLSTMDEKQQIWDGLLRELDNELDRERQQEARAVEDFERGVEAALLLGASDRQTAIRWVIEGLELDDTDLMYGGSKVCFELGLPYSMAGIFDPICKELLGGRNPLFGE